MEVFDNIAGAIKTNLIAVIGGFHLYNPITHDYESKQRIKEIACHYTEVLCKSNKKRGFLL